MDAQVEGRVDAPIENAARQGIKQRFQVGQILRQTFLSLRTRNFRLFFIGQLISNTGNWLTNVAIVLLVLKLTGSGFAIGLLSAVQYGPILFLSAYAGVIADRFDKRRSLFITQGLEMAQSVGLAIVAFMPHPSIPALFVLALLGGILLSFDNPLRRSFVTEMVPPEDIPNAVVMYSTIVNVSRIFGPALAGLLVVTVGYGWCFAIDAASYIAVIICLIMMRPQELYTVPRKPKGQNELQEGVRYVLGMPVLWISFVMLAAIGTISYNFTVTLPVFVTNTLQSTDRVFTIIYSLFSFGAVICAFFVAHRNLVTMRHIIIGAASLGVSMFFLALAPGVWSAGLLIFVVGMASILYMTSTTAIIQVDAKREMHGRVLALQSALMIGTTLIGGPLCGWLADAYGGRVPIIVGSLVALLAAAFGYYASQRYVQVKAAQEVTEAPA